MSNFGKKLRTGGLKKLWAWFSFVGYVEDGVKISDDLASDLAEALENHGQGKESAARKLLERIHNNSRIKPETVKSLARLRRFKSDIFLTEYPVLVANGVVDEKKLWLELCGGKTTPFGPVERATAKSKESKSQTALGNISLTYDPMDAFGKGCVFHHQNPRTGVREVYLRIRAFNNSQLHLGQISVDLVGLSYRSQQTDPWTILANDPHPLNWAFSHGKPRDLQPRTFRYADLITFRDGFKLFDIMIARRRGGRIYWQDCLDRPGFYLLNIRVYPRDCAKTEMSLIFQWKGELDFFRPTDLRIVKTR